MAGEIANQRDESGSNVVVIVEQSALELLPDPGVNVAVLEAKDWAGPDTMTVHPAVVDKNLCAHCLACIKLCPSLSWDMEKAHVVVNEVSCKGCGICGSVCPAGAISQRHFSSGMVLEAIARLWESGGNGRQIDSCNNCPVEPLVLGRMKTPSIHDPSVRVICSGRVEPLHVLETAKIGARGLLMVDCFTDVPEKDRFERGKKRMDAGEKLLRTLGSPVIRVEAVNLNARNVSELPLVLQKFSRRTNSTGGGAT